MFRKNRSSCSVLSVWTMLMVRMRIRGPIMNIPAFG